jgi:hypothetical protein
MYLTIPYLDKVDAVDARLMALAEFLGVPCQTISLDRGTRHYAAFLEKAITNRDTCFLVNPRVLERWIGEGEALAQFASCLVSRFPRLLVHGLAGDGFDSQVVSALSQGRLQSVQAIGNPEAGYKIEEDGKDICEAFAGLKFGPANPVNDHIFVGSVDGSGVRKLISIDGRPFMVCVRHGETDIMVLGSKDVVDLNSPAADSPVALDFSRLVPQTMALRHLFGAQAWRPVGQHACVVIDDPLLRRSYGFLRFEDLLHLVETHNFHACIAFIPHNYRRNLSRTVDLFRNNSSRLSICFHGCDHTKGEMASTDTALLNTLLRVAETRMKRHELDSGLVCDKVMVFPQGAFSIEAMEVLKARNFLAAVNTLSQPQGQSVPLTIREMIQPAVTRYRGFPLFLRRYVEAIRSEEIAFNLLFAKPILIVEHHQIFEKPGLLVEAIHKVNSLAPAIKWSRLETTVSSSVLQRTASDGTQQIRSYSGKVRIYNDSNRTENFSVEWNYPGASASVDQVLKDGEPCAASQVSDSGVRVSAQLQPLNSATFSLVHGNPDCSRDSLSLSWNAKAFLRRRLSELRDNHLSRNPRLLNAARTLRERYLSSV